MKKFLLLSAVLVFCLTPVVVGQSGQPTWKKIPIPKLPEFHPQEPKRIELQNGMVVFLQEDHELPTIDAIARIRGGSRAESAAKVGLLSLYGEVWRTGGTKTQTGDQLDDYLEIRAAKVETDGSADSTTLSLSCLKEDFNDVFKVFRDLLREPEFREDKLDLAKREAFDGISAISRTAKLPSLHTARRMPTREFRSMRLSGRSLGRTCWIGTTPTFIPTTLFSELSGTLIRRKWKSCCGRALEIGRKARRIKLPISSLSLQNRDTT